jgi:hypothetical protein
MMNETITLSYEKALKFLFSLPDLNLETEYDFKKNQVVFYDQHQQKLLKYNYPLSVNLTESIIKDKNLLNNYISGKTSFLLMLIQAGHAALGYYQDDKLQHHKVIRKYMVRKKQGKAQLKYLKTRGKSRAGSRIRLANSVLFFEEINQYLNDWVKQNRETIIYSCGPMLWGMLFQSKTPPPFDKKDQRLKKLPLSIDVPNFEILKNTAQYAQRGYIYLFPECRDDLKEHLLSTIKYI